jgi:xanthine dehydrogenase YagR molybdenum-binding subunit
MYSGKLRVEAGGRVVIQTPIIEQGAGMLTVFRRIVAEELGLPIDRIHIEQSVEGIDEDRGVGGSRTTRLVGKLLIQLSRRIQSKISELVGAEFGCPPESISAASGGFVTPDGRRITFSEAVALADTPLVESLAFRATQRDRSSVAIAEAAEVSVDPETGAVTPLRLLTVQEAGRIIDPLLFNRQIEGGVVQGLGYALIEHLVVENGRVQNLNLHDYKLPTQPDVPALETRLIGHEPRLGITPVGEGASAGVAPAIANAVVDVVGPTCLDLPLAPEPRGP